MALTCKQPAVSHTHQPAIVVQSQLVTIRTQQGQEAPKAYSSSQTLHPCIHLLSNYVTACPAPYLAPYLAHWPAQLVTAGPIWPTAAAAAAINLALAVTA
jgi:hypothetical protein